MALGKRITSYDNGKAPPVNTTNGGAQPHTHSQNITIQKDTLSVAPKYTFDDIILNTSTYNDIQDVLTIYDKRDMIFNHWGLSSTHKYQSQVGINLYGDPGTGKTMAAHAIAFQLNRKLLIVDYSQIESKYVGETSKNLSVLFEQAKAERAILFFDEADALLSKRVTNMSSSTDVSANQTRSHLLVLINDYNDIILFATNFITNYDPAFMRRIAAHIKFELPDESNRFNLWRKYIPAALPNNADSHVLARDYIGVSGSDISKAVLSAALRAARQNERTVRHEYFAEAISAIIRSKQANAGEEIVSKRIVSEDYVKKQLGGPYQ